MLKNSFLTLKFELEAKAHLGGTGQGKLSSGALAAEFCVVPCPAGRTFCQQRFGEKTLKFILRVFTHDPDSLV